MALLDAGITVFFVTHRFGFAQHFHRQQAGTTPFLRAERQPDRRRSYKLAVKVPLSDQFREELYHQLGGWLGEGRGPIPPRRLRPRTLAASLQAPADRQKQRNRGHRPKSFQLTNSTSVADTTAQHLHADCKSSAGRLH